MEDAVNRMSSLIEDSRIENIEVDKLHFDLENVRFKHIFFNKIPTEVEIYETIWKDKDTKSLYQQIIAAGGVFEPLLVTSNYVVKEGNRRLACLKKIINDAKEGKINEDYKKFETVVCRKLPTNINQTDLSLYLAAIHVKGKKKWEPFDKASYIYGLYKEGDISYDSLAKNISMGKATVIRFVRAFEETQKYHETYSDEADWWHKYTYFDELFKSKALKEFRVYDKNIDKFSQWVHDKKFRDVRDVRALADILNDKNAARIFEESGAKEALRVLEEIDPSIKSTTFKQVKRLYVRLKGLPPKELIDILQDSRRQSMLNDLRKEIDTILRSSRMHKH